MAKQANTKTNDETNLPATVDDMVQAWRDMGLSEEQINELRGYSGQNNTQSYESLPILRINMYYDEDKKGRTVKHGNWVLNQKTEKNKEGEDEVIDYGTDLGVEPEVIFYAAPQQYSKAGTQATRCNSQLLFNPGDVAVGSKYGFNCKEKTCPYRQEGVADKDKCRCQFVTYGTVKVGEETTPFISYQFRKSCFMGMSDYMKSLGAAPLYMQTTVLKKDRKKNGNVTYYEAKPEKGRLLNMVEFKEATTTALEMVKGIKTFEQQRETKNKQLSHKPSQSTEGLGFEEAKEPAKEGTMVFD